MPLRLDARSPDFATSFRALLSMKREAAADVDQAAQAIIAEVRATGDAALIGYSRKFDRVDLEKLGLRVEPAEIDAALGLCQPEALAALKLAHQRIVTFHERQRPADERFVDALGVELGWRWSSIESVGLYVPGGTASYPSSVLMNATPAKVAGVDRVVMVVPAPDGKVNPLVFAAAKIAGVDEIYRVGRRSGDRGAGLRNANNRSGRQNRRPGQCLCRRRQAAGFWRRWNRYDRRTF